MSVNKVLRWFLVAVFAYLLAMSLLFVAGSAVFSYLTAKPERLKAVLNDSGVYQKIPGILYDNIQEQNRQEQSDIDLGDPEIRQAALDNFSPQFFQKNIEASIDGTYAWLEGETSQPEFMIDATEAKNGFIESVIAREVARAQQLPDCNLQQLRQIDPATIDIFNLPCLPPGTNLGQIAQQAKAELRENSSLLDDSRLDAQEIKDESGQPIFNGNSSLPDKFQLAKNATVFLTIIACILAAGIFLVSSDRKKGLGRIAKILAAAGLVTVLTPFFLNFVSNILLSAASTERVVSEIASPIIREFNSAAASIYYFSGGIMLVLGIGLLVAIHKNVFKFPGVKR